jgi:hypothetical protein
LVVRDTALPYALCSNGGLFSLTRLRISRTSAPEMAATLTHLESHLNGAFIRRWPGQPQGRPNMQGFGTRRREIRRWRMRPSQLATPSEPRDRLTGYLYSIQGRLPEVGVIDVRTPSSSAKGGQSGNCTRRAVTERHRNASVETQPDGGKYQVDVERSHVWPRPTTRAVVLCSLDDQKVRPM